ncbi:hypothetical protein HUE56_30240 (plasmid) [Azospirillum oryzae]|uniref:Uncharacterized protein n=1 Tax=Azospirillum oryzae TaxID=286727 RepID=A0A6N1ASN7_9PROT|nr:MULTISPECIES: hypothetical protein [Azospirillum]KAA0585359.1 hypothetical protein FZ938_25555 [Azospirillum oryzae]QCG99373.1 hypothetical protein E6C67_37015 [Azospirillum sp. TSA2s]QKS54781.1 hypothetical protein HUE56_30240 [Azospirillum oryzae]
MILDINPVILVYFPPILGNAGDLKLLESESSDPGKSTRQLVRKAGAGQRNNLYWMRTNGNPDRISTASPVHRSVSRFMQNAASSCEKSGAVGNRP